MEFEFPSDYIKPSLVDEIEILKEIGGRVDTSVNLKYEYSATAVFLPPCKVGRRRISGYNIDCPNIPDGKYKLQYFSCGEYRVIEPSESGVEFKNGVAFISDARQWEKWTDETYNFDLPDGWQQWEYRDGYYRQPE